jgi:iron complex outermembrane receptor protein
MSFTRKTWCAVSAIAIVTSLGATSPTLAQVDEIIVTAQKRQETLGDIGLSVSAVSGDVLQELNVTEPRDLFQGIPNVSLATNATAGQLQLSIRGVNFLSFSPISVQPVLVYQDDVVLNSPQASGLFIFDLERVEVLRGPQNTLYGRNTTGGAVNFIAKKPEIGGGAGGYAFGSFGSYGSYSGEAAVYGSLGERAAFRVAMQTTQTDGLWENLATGDRQGDRNQTVIRGQLAFEPNDTSDFRLELHAADSTGGQRGIKTHGLFADAGFGGAPCADIDLDDLSTTCVDGFGGATNAANDEVISDLRDDRDDITAFGASLTGNFDVGTDLTLTSISAYEENTYDHWEDADGLPLPFVLFRQKSDTEQWSQELRLSSSDVSQFRWILGAYAFSESTTFSTAVPIALFDPAASFSDNNLVDHDTSMYSIFGKADYDVSDRLTLSAGLRLIHEEKSGNAQYQFAVGLDALDVNNADAFLFDSLTAFRAPGSYINAEFDESWNLWGGELGIEYETDAGHLLYGRIARGQKAGQFTDAPDAIANGGFFTPADEETVLSYEVGAKAEFMDRKLVTNVAVFFNDYEDQQQQVTLPGPVSTVVNVASSETYGVEFDATYAPGDGWVAQFSAGFLETKVKEDSLSALTGGALSIREGRELTNSPNLTLGASLSKEWVFENDSSLKAQVDINHVGERNFDLLEIAVDPVFVTDPSYTLVNFAANYRFGEDNRYRAGVFGKNIFDETYYTLMQEFDIGNAILFTGNPATYGVTLGMDF